jgi:Tol biopolymer transport system component
MRVGAAGLVLVAIVISGCATGFAGKPTYVSDLGATANGLVTTTQGGSTSYWVQYGATDSYGRESAHRARSLPAGQGSFRVSVPIAGLTPSSLVHYRLCAQDQQAGVGPGCSADATLTTGPAGGRSGIAFSSNRGPGLLGNSLDVVAMGSDGSNPTDLTNSESSGDGTPSWSPDARRIAYTTLRYDQDGRMLESAQIHVMNADGSGDRALTSPPGHQIDPAWSPDGSRIAFAITRVSGVNADLFVMNGDGANSHNITATPATGEGTPAWSPDGSRIAYSLASPGNNGDIFTVRPDGSDPVQLTRTPNLNEGNPAYSPDGTKIAYNADVGGTLRAELFVMDADGGNQTDVSQRAGGEYFPTWSPDGSRIAFAADNLDISSMPALGGAAVKLTNDAFSDFDPAWSPRPSAAVTAR